jgi:Ser/Thr protein kinase RdoA (MazF antagonist)
MRPVAFSAEHVRTALRTSWQCSPGDCVPLTEHLWRVNVGDESLIAKRVPVERRARFEAGLSAAERLESAGIAAGEPIRAADGALTVPVENGALALVTWVPGRPLHADDPIDQQWWGDTLANVHRALRDFTHPGLAGFRQVRDDTPWLSLEPWLRPAIRDASAAVRRLRVTDQLTYGVLHGEPSPGQFRLDPATGRVGLVDWDSAGTGPLVYDLAAAVLFAGGPGRAADVVDGYVSAGVVSVDECEAALPTMLAFRAAVKADRLAERLSRPGGSQAGRAADQEALRSLADVLEG